MTLLTSRPRRRGGEPLWACWHWLVHARGSSGWRGTRTARSGGSRAPLLDGWGVYHATLDPRNGVIYVAANHYTYGPTVQRSADGGRTWRRSKRLDLPGGSELAVNATWHIEPGRPHEPEMLYLGGDPAVLFRSDDGGETWQANRGILEHPTRDQWLPGAGGLCCHSIQLDPSDALRMYVALTGGRHVPHGRWGCDLDAAQQGRCGRFPSGTVPGGRPVCAQTPPSPRTTGTAVAAEPLRRLPVRRPGRILGPARRERSTKWLRLPDHDRPEGPGRGVRDPGEGP